MINALFNRLFSTEAYSTASSKDRARTTYGVILILIVLYSFFVVSPSSAPTGLRSLLADAGRSPYIALTLLSFYGLAAAALLAVYVGRATLAGYLVLAMWTAGGVNISVIATGMNLPSSSVTAFALIILGGLLLRERGIALSLVLVLGAIFIGISRRQAVGLATVFNTRDLITLSLLSLGYAGVIYLYLRRSRVEQNETQIQAAEERSRLATVTSQLARRVTQRTTLQDVLNTAIDEITASYPKIYHSQIFLIDERRINANLVASTGEVGRRLLARNHTLPVGSRSVIGNVTSTGDAVIAVAGADDLVHQPNDLLPTTAVEAAFPLRVAALVIGVLDLQSEDATAFPESERAIFQSLADSIAVAIDNARLFEQTERRLRDQQRLIDEASGAVQEIERLNRQLTERAWSGYLAEFRGEVGVSIDFVSKVNLRAGSWTLTQREVMQTGGLVRRVMNERLVVAVPVRVRGQTIGALEFEMPDGATLFDEDVQLMEAVAERLGQAAENGRLYSETRRTAQREATVNEIGARLQATTTVDAVLTEAARGLQDSLSARRVAIRLGTSSRTAVIPRINVNAALPDGDRALQDE